jgi:hypothetical protein
MQNGNQIKRADEILNTSLRPPWSPREQSWGDNRPLNKGKARPPTTKIIRDKMKPTYLILDFYLDIETFILFIYT